MVFLSSQNFALHIHRDLAREIAVGHGGGDFGDVSHLSRQVAGHGVDAVRQVFPHAADALHHRLAAEFALGAHLARHAGDFGCEGIQLRHHGVHHARGVQELALERAAVHLERHGLRQVALGHRRR